jgi:hypothetical protein
MENSACIREGHTVSLVPDRRKVPYISKYSITLPHSFQENTYIEFLCDIKPPQHFPGIVLWKICGLYLGKYCKSTSRL